MSSISLPPSDLPNRRFSVDEYHQLIRAGILTENDSVELLEGWLVPRLRPHTPRRDTALRLLHSALEERLPVGWDIRNQSGLTTSDSEPEPDYAVVRGDTRTYVERHPGPQDVGTLIEVAESTLIHDRGDKARVYARAGIVIYWIINLVDRQVEVYTDPTGPDAAPRYRQRQDYPEAASVPLVLDGQQLALVPVRDLLP